MIRELSQLAMFRKLIHQTTEVINLKSVLINYFRSFIIIKSEFSGNMLVLHQFLFHFCSHFFW